jgi:hypothetical protein
MLLGGEGGLAAAGKLGVGVFLHVEGLLHHVGGVVDGGSLQQPILLLIHCESHPVLFVMPHVVCFCEDTIEPEFIRVSLTSFCISPKLHPEEISNLKNSPLVRGSSLVSSA